MNDQDRVNFETLTALREHGADLLEQPFLSGVQRSVVEKYSEKAHFVYELIQNADDAGATYARFVLSHDGLIFAHNGTRHFSVSNPETEGEDGPAGNLGDVNSITAIAFSNKGDTATIGKFGVGFKAVFTYTETPHVYGPTLHFKIERFLVPRLLENDHPDRKEEETLFLFPFDKAGMLPSVAESEIESRLQALVFPVLFLNHLERIDYSTPSNSGHYSKQVLDGYDIKKHSTRVSARLLSIESSNASNHDAIRMWLMSSTNRDGFKCSVGFFVDEEGTLRPIDMPAFCFFPTKVNTGLSFILNAPFLLTDSREGIKDGDEHNENMISSLAKLAANSIALLCAIGEKRGERIINDNMFDVIPYKMQSRFWYSSNTSTPIMFNPVIAEMMDAIKNGPVLPGVGCYRRAKDSYFIESAKVAGFLDEDHLKELLGVKAAGRVLPGLSTGNVPSDLKKFLTDIGVRVLTDDLMLKHLSCSFVAKQELGWLGKLHDYIADSQSRSEKAKSLPVFLDSKGQPVAAFDDRDNMILFMPSIDDMGYHMLSQEALAETGTQRLAKTYDLKNASREDWIISSVIPSVIGEKDPRNVDAFTNIYKCYKDEGESLAFLRRLAEYPFLAYKTGNEKAASGSMARELYLPSEQLKDYFGDTRGVKFVDVDFYQQIIVERDELEAFLRTIGVAERPRVISRTVLSYEAQRMGVNWEYSTPGRPESWEETDLDGLREAINRIDSGLAPSYSVTLWNVLVDFIRHGCMGQSPDNKLKGTHRYFYYGKGEEYFETRSLTDLKRMAWIFDRDGKRMVPHGADKKRASDVYNVESSCCSVLADFLGMQDPEITEKSEREKFADSVDDMTLKACGLTFGEIMNDPDKKSAFEQFLASFAPKENVPDASAYSGSDTDASAINKANSPKDVGTDSPLGHNPSFAQSYERDSSAEPKSQRSEAQETTDTSFSPSGTASVREHFRSLPDGDELGNVAEDLARRVSRRRSAPKKKTGTKGKRKNSARPKTERVNGSEYDSPDDDALIPATIDYEHHTEKARERCAREIDNIEREQHLRNSAIAATKYSMKWFRSLLELEMIYDSADSERDEFTISFASVRLEEGATRTLLLEQPSRAIPASVEDLTNIPLVLDLADRTHRVEIEVASIKSYTLRARLKDGADLRGIDLKKVDEARIEVRNPTFLLKELANRFDELGHEDSFNLRDNLPENIEFVFGPPGTGKTTHLARNVLIPLMMGDTDESILVLAPTNKAADVLANKVVECSGDINTCKEWLVRFGSTNDSFLEESGVFRDKTFDLSSLHRRVVITTVARYPYDYLMTDHGHEPIRDMEWDHIVIDEASMISCAQIAYPLYRAKPKTFVVAGDPHQIAPVLKVDLWEGENIYTMVGLNSFKDPATVPHRYKVTLLGTQYRSIPSIGSVFSEFSYDGMLSSARADADADRAYLGSPFSEHAINVVKFPVSTYESVCKSKRLSSKSAYHPYSALLAIELVRHISSVVRRDFQNRSVSIGLVTPYRAQADILSGLLAQLPLPNNVSAQAGTIHGFQGDECDVMIVVLNTPPQISANRGMFLNRRNIINVSISRARDSLIILAPDEETKYVDRLIEVNRLLEICRCTGSMKEYSAASIEELLLGSPTFIADSCFTTGHHSVNVYGSPENRYEIRSEWQAVDIQVRGDTHSETPMGKA